jgi:hypothetical protein
MAGRRKTKESITMLRRSFRKFFISRAKKLLKVFIGQNYLRENIETVARFVRKHAEEDTIFY